MKFSAISALALAAVVSATHTVTVTAPPSNPTPPPASQCNTDHLYCCNQSNLVAANSPIVGPILGLLGIAVQPITALVGISCSPIVGILNGNSCSQSPVCCQNNDFDGLIVIGCNSVTL